MTSPTSKLLATAKKYGTPLYAYDLKSMLGEIQRFKKALGPAGHVHYAVKANFNRQLLKSFSKTGIGADVVSGGEIAQAVACGFKPRSIIFSGVGKTEDEIRLALRLGLKQINVESPQELIRIAHIAGAMRKLAPVAFRMNPDVNARTHPYIATGFRENKFGMDASFIPELKRVLNSNKKALKLNGLTLHIGSQLMNLKPLQQAITKTIPIYRQFQSEGHNLESFDVGGGLAIAYQGERIASIETYGKLLHKLLAPLHCQILCEPGRAIVGAHGWLIGEVQYIKKTRFKNFVILDTGMNHLIRTPLYQAKHRILHLENRTGAGETYDVVGPICESADVLGYKMKFKGIRQGDHLAICDAGAYGFAMASHYNLHALPREVLI